MPTPAQPFDAHLPEWKAWQQAPWGLLRYRVAQANLRRHLPPRPLHILDAGSGNGLDTLPLAAEGHHVTLLDFSHEMLTAARQAAEERQVADHLDFVHGDVLALPTLFPTPRFDVVLCHNVLQYVDDAVALLQAVTAPLRQGGVLSVMSTNRFTLPLRTALQGDLEAAYAQLDTTTAVAGTFEVPVRQYAAVDVLPALSAVGCTLLGQYGVRCVCDYLPDQERKADPAYFAQLEQLEYALADKYPYYLIARFFHLVAHRSERSRTA